MSPLSVKRQKLHGSLQDIRELWSELNMQKCRSRMMAHEEPCLQRNISSHNCLSGLHQTPDRRTGGPGQTPQASPADIWVLSVATTSSFFQEVSSNLSSSRCRIVGFMSAHMEKPPPLHFHSFISVFQP